MSATVPVGGQRTGQTLLRNPSLRFQEQPLVPPSTPLGRLEALLRVRGPTSADRLAALLRCRRSTALALLHRHPLAYHNGRPRRASRWALARVGSDLLPPRFDESELSTRPFSEQQFVECPVCGATHAVLPGVARKIERGLRTGRCPRCVGAGAWVERSPLSNQEREVLSRWWLKRFSDSELAKFAQALGVEHASAEAIAITRVRNGRL